MPRYLSPALLCLLFSSVLLKFRPPSCPISCVPFLCVNLIFSKPARACDLCLPVRHILSSILIFSLFFSFSIFRFAPRSLDCFVSICLIFALCLFPPDQHPLLCLILFVFPRTPDRLPLLCLIFFFFNDCFPIFALYFPLSFFSLLVSSHLFPFAFVICLLVSSFPGHVDNHLCSD